MQPAGLCPVCKAGTIKYAIKSGYNNGQCSNCLVISSYTWLPEYAEMIRLNPSLVPIYLKRPYPTSHDHS